MSTYVLDKAYRISEEAGVEAGRVVVRGDSPDECSLPAGANAAAVLGITTHAQPRTGRFVGVRRLGIVSAVAAGAIVVGEPVCIADAMGRVAQLARPTFTTGAGTSQLIWEWIDASSFSLARKLALINPGSTTAFSWAMNGSTLELTLSYSGGITQTVATMIAAIAADAALSKILRVSKGGSATDGTTLAAASAVAPTNIATSVNPIGIAEESAAQAGDIIDIYLNA